MFETYYVNIEDEIVPIKMMISKEPITIDDEEWFVVEHKSGHRKGLTQKGVNKLKSNSAKYEALLKKNGGVVG
tara:strand:+ start:1057 stop:1275 length:219 start_codon:yes stop_codon:yes gene_type:complete